MRSGRDQDGIVKWGEVARVLTGECRGHGNVHSKSILLIARRANDLVGAGKQKAVTSGGRELCFLVGLPGARFRCAGEPKVEDA